MEENQNRILLAVTLLAIVFGGATLWVQHKVKTRQPVIGWHELGTETFELKPSAYKAFTYQDLPAKFRVEVQASDPVAFGFVTPDAYGHFTSTVSQIDFPAQPCGSGSVTNADVNCATVAGQRYLLLTDLREDPVPVTQKGHGQNAKNPPADSSLPPNHVTVKMYDWRCLKFCENLPRA